MGLSEKSCIPCRGGIPPLTGDEIRPLTAEVPEWRVVDDHHIERSFGFSDFAGALDFVNRVGALAEEEGHHPELCFGWGHVDLSIWTHKVDGLTESDFILAAKIDELDRGRESG